MDDTPSGYAYVPTNADVARWRHRLFIELRRAPAYRRLLDRLRSTWQEVGQPAASGAVPLSYARSWGWRPPVESARYFDALDDAARTLGLVFQGRPASWAVDALHDDVRGSFDEATPRAVATMAYRRLLELVAGPDELTVTTYSDVDSPYTVEQTVEADGTEAITWTSGRIQSQSMSPATPMVLGARDWTEFEAAAIKAVKQAVAELRTEFEGGASMFPRKRIARGREAEYDLQIARLALRLLGRAGQRNHYKTDERWFRRLGLDQPSQRSRGQK